MHSLHFVDTLSDPSMIAFALRGLSHHAAALKPFPKIGARLFKYALKQWATNIDSHAEARDAAQSTLRAYLRALPADRFEGSLKNV